MTIKFRNRSGDLLLEVDSDTLSTDRPDVVFHACPVCGCAPILGRDSGVWYFIGHSDCAACSGAYAAPDEGELADMSRRNK